MTYRFGDLVTINDDMGVYMYIGPYYGPRGIKDEKSPASWVADVDTEYSRDGHPAVIWSVDHQLERIDD